MSQSRRPSALSSLLRGFPDPRMETQHLLALHRASSTSLTLLALASGAMALLELLRAVIADESLIQASPVVVWASGYALVDQIRIRQPRIYDTYIEAWPLLLSVTRAFSALWGAAGMPLRHGLGEMIRDPRGSVAVLAMHVVTPAVFGRTRLLLTCIVWAIITISHCLMMVHFGGCPDLSALILRHVLPCLLGFMYTVFQDYKGRCRLLLSRGGKVCSDNATFADGASGAVSSGPTIFQPANDLKSLGGGERAVGVVTRRQRIPGFTYHSRIKGSTIRLKVQHAHPDQLPPDWLASVNQSVMDEFQHCLISATVREGCIEVVLDMRPFGNSGVDSPLDAESATAWISQIVTELLPKDHRQSPASSADRSNEPIAFPQSQPVLTHLSPCVMQLPVGFSSTSHTTLTFTAQGEHLDSPGTELIVTCQGRHIPVTTAPARQSVSETMTSTVTLCCPLSSLPTGMGTLHVTARRGDVASSACSVLLLSDSGMVSELQQLPLEAESDEELQDILCDLGQWTDVVQGRLAAAHDAGSSTYQEGARIAPSSLDLTGQLADVLVLRGVERAMVPTGIDLLHFFCRLGWQHCASAVLSDLLNPGLGWSVTPDEMWRHLQENGAENWPLLELAGQGTDRSLGKRLTAIAQAAGCSPITPAGRADAYATPSMSGQSISSSGQPDAQQIETARPTSAWRAVLWGFPDPRMETQHRLALHRVSSTSLTLLALATSAMALVELIRMIMSRQRETLLQGVPVAIWAAGYVAVDQIRIVYPRVFDTYIEAWPILLSLSRAAAPLSCAAGLPLRPGMVAMLSNRYGEVAVLAMHISLPAIFGRPRLLLSCLVWAIITTSQVLMSRCLGTSTSLPSLLLHQVLPCLIGFACTVYSDYKGRLALLDQQAKSQYYAALRKAALAPASSAPSSTESEVEEQPAGEGDKVQAIWAPKATYL